jgi:predicted nucleotide-binding protein (sugar kinase/HSP70/actin superfamily)
MGRFGTPLLAKAFARKGIHAEVLPVADEGILKLGRGNSSCKECLPLQTTVGALLHHLSRRPEKEVTAYFMPRTNGPCRFGQYHVFSKKVIAKNKIPDAAVISMNSINNYGGLGNAFTLAAWRAIIIGDLFDEIWATILAGAEDREKGLEILYREHQALIAIMDKKWSVIAKQLSRSAEELARITLKKPYDEIPKISLIGEIYVRHDPISLQNIVEFMAEQGFIVRTAQNSEWFKYLDWIVMNGIEGKSSLGFRVRYLVKKYFDREIRKRIAPSGLFFYENKVNIEPVIEAGRKFISPNLTGEAILTVGAAMHEILHPSCGVISIGPFGCMPTRIAESVLSEKFTTQEKRGLNTKNGYHQWTHILSNDRKFPFLAIETDGNAFPQIIGARLEAFLLQAQRLNDKLLSNPG